MSDSDERRRIAQSSGLEPKPVRPAATVMLVRDASVDFPVGLEVFLMRRHAAMEFAAGMTVFPGGGVDDRDRDAALAGNGAWYGPEPGWWAERFGIEADLAEALVCAAARETFEESGVLFAGTADDPDGIVRDASVYRAERAALEDRSLSFADFLRSERLVLRADLPGHIPVFLVTVQAVEALGLELDQRAVAEDDQRGVAQRERQPLPQHQRQPLAHAVPQRQHQRLRQRHPRPGHGRKHKGGATREQCAAFDPISGSHGSLSLLGLG
jgi:8-oxo-dGTP pyrophosphatase MutT (NUDIX family)